MRYALTVALMLGLAIPTVALAEEAADTRCGPFGDAVKMLDRFAKLDDDRRDIVDVRPEPKFVIEDGHIPPEQAWLRNADESRAVEVTPEGEVTSPLFADARALGEEVEFCVRDARVAGAEPGEAGFQFSANMMPVFIASGGAFTLAELKEGGKDGRKFMKAMMPGPLGILVPKLDHLMVSHPEDDAANLPRVTAWRGDESLGEVAMVAFEDTQLLEVAALEAMGADRITVEGEYRLLPMPSEKTIRRFMGGGGDANAAE